MNQIRSVLGLVIVTIFAGCSAPGERMKAGGFVIRPVMAEVDEDFYTWDEHANCESALACVHVPDHVAQCLAHFEETLRHDVTAMVEKWPDPDPIEVTESQKNLLLLASGERRSVSGGIGGLGDFIEGLARHADKYILDASCQRLSIRPRAGADIARDPIDFPPYVQYTVINGIPHCVLGSQIYEVPDSSAAGDQSERKQWTCSVCCLGSGNRHRKLSARLELMFVVRVIEKPKWY